jgi:hypothetical protein
MLRDSFVSGFRVALFAGRFSASLARGPSAAIRRRPSGNKENLVTRLGPADRSFGVRNQSNIKGEQS